MKAIKVIALICLLLSVNCFRMRTGEEKRLQTELSTELATQTQFFWVAFNVGLAVGSAVLGSGLRGWRWLQTEGGSSTSPGQFKEFTAAEAQQIMDEFFKEIDANKDGFLSFEEISQTLAKGNSKASQKDISDTGMYRHYRSSNLHNLVSQLDTDKDGKISRSEFEALREEILLAAKVEIAQANAAKGSSQ